MRSWASAVRMGCSGMPSGAGVSSRSHSSVQADLSMRAGLPVIERERWVSADVAASIFSLTAGLVSASSVVSQTEPHHTPWAPRAMAAAICRPRPMPPAPSTGTGATASTTSGIRTIEPISPVWPPASWPWAMMMSTPAWTWRSAWTALPARAPTRRPGLLHPVDHELGRWAERVGHERRAVGEGHVELGIGRGGRERGGRVADVAAQAATAELVRGELGELGHLVAGEDVGHELAVLGGDQVGDVLDLEAALVVAGVLAGTMRSTPNGLVAELRPRSRPGRCRAARACGPRPRARPARRPSTPRPRRRGSVRRRGSGTRCRAGRSRRSAWVPPEGGPSRETVGDR